MVGALLISMRRFITKWRVVRRLRKECEQHAINEGDGFILTDKIVRVAKGAFAQQTAVAFWGTETKRANEITSMLDSCIDEGLIEKSPVDFRTFIRTTPKGDDFCGFADLLQALLSKYDRVLVPVIAFVLGLNFKGLGSFLHRIIGWFFKTG
jgi:hypothetical protein